MDDTMDCKCESLLADVLERIERIEREIDIDDSDRLERQNLTVKTIEIDDEGDNHSVVSSMPPAHAVAREGVLLG